MNKVFLIGNLTKDPESSTSPNSGIKICRFTLAVNRNYNSADGNRQTDFIPIVCWRNQAENVAKFLKKGSKVGISGSIQTRTYDASDGTKRYVTEITADEVQFLSAKPGDDDLVTADTPVESKQKTKIEELKPIQDDEDLPF